MLEGEMDVHLGYEKNSIAGNNSGNSHKYVVYKDKEEFTADMKNIYNAPNKDMATAELDSLERKWGGSTPYSRDAGKDQELH